MKAIRKLDGKLIDVEVHGWNKSGDPISYHTNFEAFYKPEDLDFNITQSSERFIQNVSSFDWESFRAEAAKDILCGIVSHPNIRCGVGNTETQVGYALQYADELIRQLKEKEEIK